jgi:hypothetical protein
MALSETPINAENAVWQFHAKLVILDISKFGRKMAVNQAKSTQISIFGLFW